VGEEGVERAPLEEGEGTVVAVAGGEETAVEGEPLLAVVGYDKVK
jgi:hypothetical protein